MSNLFEFELSSVFWEKLFDVFITFLAFGFGLISHFLITRNNEKIKRKRIRRFYISWIGFSLESFVKQSIYLKKHSQAIKKDIFSPLLFNNSQFEKLNSINNEDLFYSFVIKNKGDQKENALNFHKLGTNIEFLTVSLFNIKERFNSFKEDNKNWNKDWNINFKSFKEIIVTYVFEYGESMGGFVEEILDIKDSFEKSRTVDQVQTDNIINELIEPIRQVFLKHLEFERSSVVIQGLSITDNLQSLLQKKNYIFDSYIFILNHYEVEINKTIGKIKQIFLFFENQFNSK